MRFLRASRRSRSVTIRRRFALGGAASLVTGAAAVILAGTAVPAAAATGPVSPTPASGTPQLTAYDGVTTDQVRQLVQCGSTMYAVGTFATIKRGSTTYTRNNVFSFSATSPYQVTAWDPNVNGIVNTIGLSSDCTTAYIGGKFTSVHGTAATNIAAIDTTTGVVNTGFAHSANGQVETIVRYGTHLLVGGYFGTINASSAHKYMASLNPTTGKDDGFVNLNISGNYHFCNSAGTKCSGSNATRVYNQQLSNSGTLDLVEGDFTSVGGQSRQQIFMLDLSGATAAVTPWTSTEFSENCWYSEPFYLQAASWSPDDSTVYVATTGYRPYNLPGRSYPLSGLCDAAAAFPAAQQAVSHKWINYTGCDSLYSTAADAGAAYFGGHERWSQNPNGCDFAGPGAISAPGMEGLSPATGALLRNAQGGSLYTRGRGRGADDMLVTNAGLWIASDNYNNANYCGGVSGHAGICLLPYPA